MNINLFGRYFIQKSLYLRMKSRKSEKKVAVDKTNVTFIGTRGSYPVIEEKNKKGWFLNEC